MLFVARSTALPTPGEGWSRWAKTAEAVANVARRSSAECFIAMISLFENPPGTDAGLHPNLSPNSPRRQWHLTALRNAKRTVMQERGNRHPFYWAAFEVIGDGGPLMPILPAR
jgi:hypothetical protein